MKIKKLKRLKSHKKIRMKISGTANCPRLCVFKSNKHIYAQLIDDENGKILLSASDVSLKTQKTKKVNRAEQVGKMIAKMAIKENIKKVVFDRGGFVFHGRIKAVADGAREAGLQF